jgi:uncharacterized protein (DUF2141 family)
MKKKLALLCISAILPVSAFATDVTLNVSKVKGKGEVRVAVCNKDTFNIKDTKSQERDCFAALAQPLNGAKQASFQITDVPEGEWAFFGFIDENANQKLDTNFLGIPKETVLFSKSYSGFPDFEEVSSKVSGDTMEVNIRPQ